MYVWVYIYNIKYASTNMHFPICPLKYQSYPYACCVCALQILLNVD